MNVEKISAGVSGDGFDTRTGASYRVLSDAGVLVATVEYVRGIWEARDTRGDLIGRPQRTLREVGDMLAPIRKSEPDQEVSQTF